MKYVHSLFTKGDWKMAYWPFIHSMAHEAKWIHNWLPPIYKKQPRRLKKVRAREPEES